MSIIWRNYKRRFKSLFGICLIICMLNFAVKDIKAQEPSDSQMTSSEGNIELNILVAAIDPNLSSIDGQTFSNGEMQIKASEYLGFSLEESVNMWCENFEEVSHESVDINVIDTVVLDEFPKYKSQASLDNQSFLDLFPKDDAGHGDWYAGITNPGYAKYDTWGDLDYDHYIETLNLVDRKNAGEFDMVFLIGIDPLSPYETCMVGRNAFWVNGEPIQADCDNFIIVTPTFSRKDGSIENIGHLAENMLGYTYGAIEYTPGAIDGSDIGALNDWQKYCLCEYLATPNTEVYGYGMVHFSPNSESDYDWSNPKLVKYYRDWQNSEDVADFSPSDCYLDNPDYAYNDDACISHHRWWFANMPYEDGRDEEGYYQNWWRYIFTPDYVTEIRFGDACSDGEISLAPGEEIPLDFDICYYSGKVVSTDVTEAGAPIFYEENEFFSYENGKIKANKDGTGNVVIKLDGKCLEYKVTVGAAIAGEKAGEDMSSDGVAVRDLDVNNNRDTEKVVFAVIMAVLGVAGVIVTALGIVKISTYKKKYKIVTGIVQTTEILESCGSTGSGNYNCYVTFMYGDRRIIRQYNGPLEGIGLMSNKDERKAALEKKFPKGKEIEFYMNVKKTSKAYLSLKYANEKTTAIILIATGAVLALSAAGGLLGTGFVVH